MEVFFYSFVCLVLTAQLGLLGFVSRQLYGLAQRVTVIETEHQRNHGRGLVCENDF